MKYDPAKHHRRSIRLKGYDYSQPGAYFVTICTQNRECLFGDIVDGAMVLNDAGQMVETWYTELENKFPDMVCDQHVIMPNHVHFIVINVGADLRVCPPLPYVRHQLRSIGGHTHEHLGEPVCSPLRTKTPSDQHDVILVEHTYEPTALHKTNVGADLCVCPPLHTVVQWFKTMTTNHYIRGVKQFGWPQFDRKLWQRNYYEHIIRDENEYEAIRQYIINNPSKWWLDRENPEKPERRHG